MLRKIVDTIRYVPEALNERRYGVKTYGNIPPEELGFPPAGRDYVGGLYRASSWPVLRHVFKELRISQQDVFVDYGSGMGRVLILAARQPFKRVLGVEMSEELNEVARENIDRHRDRLRCDDVEIVNADAREWEVPDDLTIAYFYCPFPPRIFEGVVRQLLASVDRRPRRLRVVYYLMTAEDRELLLATGRAKQLEYREPWRLRKRLGELWMFELLPRTASQSQTS
ncbi:MAG: class I SAM-dependent methyltransferase [Thermoleophilaceae bacterium]